MKLTFDKVVIDTNSFELSIEQVPVHVEPRVFSLLVYMAENPQRVITLDELISTVWKGRIVSESTVSGCVKHARKAIGDDGNKQSIIKTVRGRGFRFCADVANDEASSPVTKKEPFLSRDSTAECLIEPAPSEAVEFNPSLVVQQFQLLSESNSLVHFTDGLSMALTNVLARIPLLRMSALTDKHAMLMPQDVHQATGADYVLSGNIKVVGEHIQIMTQLCDGRTGFNLWSHQFRIKGTEESSHDASVLAIVAKLEPQLYRAMYEKARSQKHEPTAVELYLQASGILALKGWHHESFHTASTLLRKSWSRAPQFAHASSYLSLVLGLGHRLGLMDNDDDVKVEAFEAAEQSLRLDSMDSSIMGLAGCALGDLGHTQRSLSILRQAVDLNPSNGQAWAALGSICLSERRVDEAIEHLNRGIELSPHDSRFSVWGGVLSTALRLSGDLQGAIEQAEKACQRDDQTYMPRVILAAAHNVASDPQQAATALKDAYRIKPDLSDKQIIYLVGRRQASGLLDLA